MMLRSVVLATIAGLTLVSAADRLEDKQTVEFDGRNQVDVILDGQVDEEDEEDEVAAVFTVAPVRKLPDANGETATEDGGDEADATEADAEPEPAIVSTTYRGVEYDTIEEYVEKWGKDCRVRRS